MTETTIIHGWSENVRLGAYTTTEVPVPVLPVFITAALLTGVCSFVIASFFFGYDYSRFFSLPYL